MDDVVIVRNVARHPVWIGKELVEPGGVWSGERGFVMIALWRYPGRLVFVEEAPSPPAPLPEEAERGEEPPPNLGFDKLNPSHAGGGVDEGRSGDNSLLSSEGEERQKAKGEGKSPVKRARRRKAATNE